MGKHLSCLTCFVLASALGAPSFGLAQSSGYGGVVPGSGNVPETVTARPGNDRVVTWPGFQMLPDGSSRVFVQTTIEVKPELKRSGSGYVVVIPGCVLPRGNARLPLDTQYFNTPVKSVRAKELGSGGVGILLELRTSVTPTIRTEKAENGFFFIYIEFPVGDYR
jgi:hypothetical protein